MDINMDGIDVGNQEAKADAGKLDYTLVPLEIMSDIAKVRMYGVKKYPNGGKDNWKRVEIERYRAAMWRHLIAYTRDPYGVDEESGLPHRWHLETNLAFLAELERDELEKEIRRIERKDD